MVVAADVPAPRCLPVVLGVPRGLGLRLLLLALLVVEEQAVPPHRVVRHEDPLLPGHESLTAHDTPLSLPSELTYPWEGGAGGSDGSRRVPELDRVPPSPLHTTSGLGRGLGTDDLGDGSGVEVYLQSFSRLCRV